LKLRNVAVVLACTMSMNASAQYIYNPDDAVFDSTNTSKIFFNPEINVNSRLVYYNAYKNHIANNTWTAAHNFTPSGYAYGGHWRLYSNSFKTETKAGGNEWFTFRSQVSRSNTGISCDPGTASENCISERQDASTTKCVTHTVNVGLTGAGTQNVFHKLVQSGSFGITATAGYSKGWSLCQTNTVSNTCKGIPGKEVYFTTEAINTFGEATVSGTLELLGGKWNTAHPSVCRAAGGDWRIVGSGGILGPTMGCVGAKPKWDAWGFYPRRNAPTLKQCRSRPLTG
jgi:hypothetical protein